MSISFTISSIEQDFGINIPTVPSGQHSLYIKNDGTGNVIDGDLTSFKLLLK